MKITISKNAHKCSPWNLTWNRWDCTQFMFGSFILHPSMWYEREKVGTHLNKIVGFGCDFFNSDSLRIAYRPAPERDMFEIYAYPHIDGRWIRGTRLKDDLIIVAGADIEYNFSIACAYEPNIARFNVGAGVVERYFPVTKGTGWVQGGWFGGKPTAPWDMAYELKINNLIE